MTKKKMNNIKTAASIAIIFLLTLNGCAAVLIGAGAAGAIVVSKDEASTYIDGDMHSVWARSLEVLKEIGSISDTDKKAGVIKALVNDSKVICIIEEVTNKTVKLRVKARKNLLPNVDLAQSIATKILKVKK